MEKLPPSETSESEKSSPTATDTKNNLKILSFSTKKEKNKNEAKEDILDLLGVVADDVVNGIDFDVLNATTGIVILANPDGEGEKLNSLVTVYTTKTNPMKLLGVLEFIKGQIVEQSSY